MEQEFISDAETSRVVERLRTSVQRRFGSAVRLENVEIAALGGSNRTVLFDLGETATTRRLVLRQETYKLARSPFISPHQQYRLLEVAHEHAIPVPEPVFELDESDDLGRGYVAACVEGETMPKRLIHDSAFAGARRVFAGQCGEILAALHAIDPERVAFLEQTSDSRDPLAAQLDRYDSYGEVHPALELGFRWLTMNSLPKPRRRLLHGDFRNGNLMVDQTGIRAVLDWECAHLGDAMEDVAWLGMRPWRFGRVARPIGGIGLKEDFATAYRAAGGTDIDPGVVRWWEIFGLVRWAILNIMQAHGHVSGKRRSLPFAACGRNTCLIEYDLMMTLNGSYD
ncbi:MAG: phosphotransferase family protein [Gammaproteobacteria bacterium]|jgi:aminoglycoside phosphotransferase (APT) family kinase protein|nr:phosphotransferase family protein [Gammaproteobacteria bacterium]